MVTYFAHVVIAGKVTVVAKTTDEVHFKKTVAEWEARNPRRPVYVFAVIS